MGSEGVERILGKAVLDKDFLKELKNDPVKAAQLAGASLSKDEIDTFKSLDFGGVEVFNKIASNRFMFIRKIDEDHDTDTDAKAQ